MKWRRGYRSGSVDDRRGQGGGFGGAGVPGGSMMLLRLLPRLGWPGLLLVLGLLVLAWVFGGVERLAGEGAGERTTPQGTDDPASFVGFVLDDVQTTFAGELRDAGRAYEPATLVLFDGSTPTGCGYGQAATGPFYCPLDEKVYIDLSFYRALHERFGAPGDFAEAYVIAHEIGHHVQNELGAAREHGIGLELQADCLAGVWARDAAARGLLDPGDVEEGMGAAAAVGDDRLQRASGRAVHPETWTHGSAEQRTTAFRRGYAGGSIGACDRASLE